MRFDRRVIYVTGGGHGIGRAICLRLAEEGGAVAVSDLDEAAARQVADTIAASGGKIRFSFEWEPSNADVFVVEPGPFTNVVADAVEEVTGRKPVLSTTGGTSDARFIKNYCSVVEFGLVGQTMHAIDERVPVSELVALTAIYRNILDRYFA